MFQARKVWAQHFIKTTHMVIKIRAQDIQIVTSSQVILICIMQSSCDGLQVPINVLNTAV